MIRARVLHVLSELADGEDLREARRRVYKYVSPVIRRRVRRKVQHALSLAALESNEADERHLHRLAYLNVLGAESDVHLGAGAVKARFEAAREGRSAPSKHAPTFLAAALLVMSAGAVAGWMHWRSLPLEALRAQSEERADAWRAGGRPRAGTTEQHAIFERTLPNWVLALDRVRASRRQNGQADSALVARLGAASSELVGASERALGPELSSFLRALVDQGEEMVLGHSPAAPDSHIRSVDAFVQALADAGLGYYVDSELAVRVDGQPGARVLMSTYTVENVSFYESEGERVRVLTIRRLDTLSFARAVLGYTREQIQDALVLRERVETHLVDLVLPALGEDARMPLSDESAQGDWIAQVEAAAAEDARATVQALAGDAGRAMGHVLQRRQELLERWQARYADTLSIAQPRGFDLHVERYAPLEARVPRREWRELEHIADELEDSDLRRAYRAVEEAFARSVERHEVQHRLDFSRGTLRHPSPLLDERLGALGESERNERAWKRRAELSAYLSELARSPALVRVNLALISMRLFRRNHWGSAESMSALMIFEGLAGALEIAHEPLVVRRRVDREALASLYLALRTREPDALSEAAAQTWTRYFGAAFAPLEAR